MIPLNILVQRMIDLRQKHGVQFTLLAVCPNSSAVLKAGVRLAAKHNLPMLFAATLNQVDRDGGYTGWTAAQFVAEMHSQAAACGWSGPLYPCLDHGGPWLKDRHTTMKLSFDETMSEVKQSLAACLMAGYQLLHIDPTVDRSLPEGWPAPIDLVVRRTLELIEYSENVRRQNGLPPIAYEVGTEEVHGGLVDMNNFMYFVTALRHGLAGRNLVDAWPCFIVGKVGTDLHTTYFDPQAAQQLARIVAPLGSLIKGHYTDWVENPELYPASGMGGANVGPEFTVEEFKALSDLCSQEDELWRSNPAPSSVPPELAATEPLPPGLGARGPVPAQSSATGPLPPASGAAGPVPPELGARGPSRFLDALEDAVYRSGRWQKWLQAGERGLAFKDVPAARRAWLVQTGARYVWTDPAVLAARRTLYENVSAVVPDPDSYVVERIVVVMEKYVTAFNLENANDILRSSHNAA